MEQPSPQKNAYTFDTPGWAERGVFVRTETFSVGIFLGRVLG